MEQDEVKRRNQIISDFIFKGQQLPTTEAFSFFENESMLFGAIAIVCSKFDVEWCVSPADAPYDAPYFLLNQKWFIAKIGGSLSPKHTTMKWASFVALSTFLETQKTIEDGTR